MVDIKKSETQIIRVEYSEYRGNTFLDIRNYYLDKESGEWRPTKKGIAIPEDCVEDVMDAIMEENPDTYAGTSHTQVST